jgi:large subunit ribosomal protein L10
MVQQKKIFIVQNLAQKINDAKAIYLTDYRGLDVSQMSQLRQTINQAGGELEVVKNRLFKLALKDSAKQFGSDDFKLTGPTAILWANQDEISPLKALVKFSDEAGLPEIKLGFFGNKLLSVEKISQLAKIPSQKQLEAKLISLISTPISGFYRTLTWNLEKLSLVIKNIADQKGGEIS